MKRGQDYSSVQDITALKSALVIREHLGFRRASEVLGVNQSVLSRRVQALEDALGVSLFQRHAGGARPTHAGERFLVEVSQALDLLQHAAAHAGAAGRGEVGRLRLGHVWPVAMGAAGGILRAYRQAVRDVELELIEASASALTTAVLDREIDVALIEFGDAPPTLDRLMLWSESWLLASPAHAPADPARGWQALRDAPLLCCPSDDWPALQRSITAHGGPQADVRVQRTSRDGVMSLVAAGVGYALAPESLAAASGPGVAFTRLPDDFPPLRLAAVWLGGADNPALRRFISQLRLAVQAPAAHCFAAE